MRPQRFAFRVLDDEGRIVGTGVEEADTWFLARAAVAQRWGVDPDLVRPGAVAVRS